MGTRAEKKIQLRNKIIEGAKAVFSKQDFEDTTMEQIAIEAGVGLGTAYNYFKSKEELYILSMAETMVASDFDSIQVDGETTNVADIISDALIKQLLKMNYVNKKIWKTVMPFVINGLKSDSKFINEVFKADLQFMDRIKELLEECIEKELLPKTFPVDLAVDMIFGHILYTLMSYLYFEDSTFDEVCVKVREGIGLLV